MKFQENKNLDQKNPIKFDEKSLDLRKKSNDPNYEIIYFDLKRLDKKVQSIVDCNQSIENSNIIEMFEKEIESSIFSY